MKEYKSVIVETSQAEDTFGKRLTEHEKSGWTYKSHSYIKSHTPSKQGTVFERHVFLVLFEKV